MSQEEVDLNKLTQKGTALHMACSLNKPAFVSMLLSKNADPSIMNNEGYIASDLCSNEEIIKIMNKESKSKENTIIKANAEVKFMKNFYNLFEGD